MKTRVYAYRDSKNKGQFSMPLCDFSDEMAERHFAMMCANNQTDMGFAPMDFDLYYLGDYDYTTGQFESVMPEFICNGASVS